MQAPARPTVDVLVQLHDRVGESPLWSAAEQALWWVDIDGQRLHRYDWNTQRSATWPTHERCGCIALHAGGGLLAAMETGLFHLQPRLQPHSGGTLAAECIAPVRHAAPGMRFNDGRCDRAGRFYAGTKVRDMALAAPQGVLYRCDGARLTPLVDGLVTPNGLAFSPDNRTMYLSDSHPGVQRVWAFDLDAAGTPSRRRLFVDMNALPGRPDGAAVDAEGGYWVCANDAGLVHRFTPDGRLDRSIAVPVAKPTMCSFGGPDLQSLFITSLQRAQAAPGEEPLAGALFVTRPGATGIAEVPFRP
jgi:sugar lactone lactonase YvrE